MKNIRKFPGISTLMQKGLCSLLVPVILLCCLLTAVAQGTGFFYTPHSTKIFLLTCILLTYLAFVFYLQAAGKWSEDSAVFMIILLGVLFRCGYVLLSGLYERQHDAGAYTGMGTDFVNPGHIGYIEYIYKFHKLPDLNPYELFAYYHPPLHHILSYLWLQLNIWLGVAEELAFENLQIVTLFYSCLCMVVTHKILRTLDIRGNGLYIGLAFMALHPATIYMAGSVNNDMLTILFMCLIILLSLRWIRNKDLKGLILLALSIGFGMITKLNSAVLALPLALIFLMHFISVIRSKDKPLLIQWIKNYACFAVVVIPIGLCWIVRNLLRFGEKPGVPVPGETSPMYTVPFSLWERLGIPTLSDWNFAFPFHPISAKACCNTWVIMFHTSLFAEEYPTDLSDLLMALSQITFFLAVVMGILTAVLLVLVLVHKKTRREDGIFLLTGYVIMLVSFAAFVIIYPYTCSSDFRYVAICLVYISIALGLGNKYYLQEPAPSAASGSTSTASAGSVDSEGSPLPANVQRLQKGLQKVMPAAMHIINAGIIAILTLISIICLFWNRF